MCCSHDYIPGAVPYIVISVFHLTLSFMWLCRWWEKCLKNDNSKTILTCPATSCCYDTHSFSRPENEASHDSKSAR